MAIRPSKTDNAFPSSQEFPFGRLANAGESYDGLGSPVKQEPIMDSLIPWELLLLSRGKSPSERQETALESQYFEALTQTFSQMDMQVGQLFPFIYEGDLPLLPPGYEWIDLQTPDLTGDDIPFIPDDHPLLASKIPSGVLPNMEGRSLTGYGDLGYKTSMVGELSRGAVLNATGQVQTVGGAAYLTGVIRSLQDPGDNSGDGSYNSFIKEIDLSLAKYPGENDTSDKSTPYQNGANGVYPKHVGVRWEVLADSPTQQLTVQTNTFSASPNMTSKEIHITAPKNFSSSYYKNGRLIFRQKKSFRRYVQSSSGALLLQRDGTPQICEEIKEVPSWSVFVRLPETQNNA